MDYFKKFISEEYEWVFEFGTDASSILLDEFRDNITDEEFENNFELFKTEATKKYINDEYYIQQLHEQMDDCFREVLYEYSEDKNKFIEEHKINDDKINVEIEEEIIAAYSTLKRYPKSKEIIKNIASKDKTCPEWIQDLVK